MLTTDWSNGCLGICTFMIGPPKIPTNIYITHVSYLHKENIYMATVSGVSGCNSRQVRISGMTILALR